MKYDFTNLDRIIEKMKAKTKTEPSRVQFVSFHRLTAEEKAHYGPNDTRFATDWTVGERELLYRVSTVRNMGGEETFILSLHVDEDGKEEPNYDPVQSLYFYTDDLYEHKRILEEWVRDVCESTPAGQRHVFDF